jgi:hypothetical protein
VRENENHFHKLALFFNDLRRYQYHTPRGCELGRKQALSVQRGWLGPPSITHWCSPEEEVESHYANDGERHTRTWREIDKIPCRTGCISYREWCEREVARLNAAGGSMALVYGKPFKAVPVTIRTRGKLCAIVEAENKLPAGEETHLTKLQS